jgi:site-specific recombinase XerD
LHPKIEEWLSEFDSKKTKDAYRQNIVKFFQATELNVENLQSMTPEEIRHVLLKWRANLLAKGTPQNSALQYINSVRSFCVQIEKPIKFRRGALGKCQPDTGSHVFSNGDLKTLFDIGDVTEKAILATACSLGWEISGFLELDRDKVKRQIEHAKANNENFIFFEDIRAKTGEARLAVLNPLAIQWVSKYLETTKSNREKLFDYTPDGINKMLNALAVKSGLKTTGQIRFHNIRKWLMSRLSRCGFNEFQIKYILGKSINVSDRTYLQTLTSEVEEKYPKVYNDYLNIVPVLNTSKEELEKLIKLNTEFDATKAQLADMIVKQQKDKEKLEEQIRDIYQYTNKRLDPLLDVIDELSKTPEGAEALRKLQANKIAQREEEYVKARAAEAEMNAKAMEEYEKSKAEGN